MAISVSDKKIVVSVNLQEIGNKFKAREEMKAKDLDKHEQDSSNKINSSKPLESLINDIPDKGRLLNLIA